MKHTPGPWKAKAKSTHWLIFAPDESEIGMVYRPDTRANAHLIAAAPDLLEASKRLLDAVCPEYDGMYPQPIRDAVEQLDDAIAKAEGRG